MTSKKMSDAEPTIDEMLEDPLVGLIMQRDGLVAGDVRAIWDAAAKRLQVPESAPTDPAPAKRKTSITKAA